MELSIPPSTLRWHSCRRPPRRLSTSTSYRTHSCNSACKMATRATVRRRSSTQSTRHSRSYLQSGLVKRVWGDRLGKSLGHRLRDRKRLSKGHTPDIKPPSTVAHNFQELRHTHHLFSTRAAMRACPRRCRTSNLTHRLYPNGCLPCPRPHSPRPSRTLALEHLPRIRNMAVESIPLRMELHHMCRGCLMAVVQTNLLIHRSPPTAQSHPRPNSASPHRTSTNSSNNGCTRYDSSS